jgi:hypothetical protein
METEATGARRASRVRKTVDFFTAEVKEAKTLEFKEVGTHRPDAESA